MLHALVLAGFLAPASSPPMYVEASALRVRADPSPKAAVQASLRINTVVEVVRTDGAWSLIRAGRCRRVEGWVHTEFLGRWQTDDYLAARVDHALANGTIDEAVIAQERLVARHPLRADHRRRLAQFIEDAGDLEKARAIRDDIAKGRITGLRIAVPGSFNWSNDLPRDDLWFGVFERDGTTFVRPVCITEDVVEGSTGEARWRVGVREAPPEHATLRFMIHAPLRETGPVLLPFTSVAPAMPLEATFTFGDTTWSLSSERTTRRDHRERFLFELASKGARPTVLQLHVDRSVGESPGILLLDVDGDGELDVLSDLERGREVSNVVLYLSSPAPRDRRLIEVASFRRENGC